MARCFAAAISQAPGLSGTPDCGHCSSAATSASCARSSATPTSRTIRVRPAMIRGDSIRQTASITRRISVALTANDHITFDPRVQANERRRAALHCESSTSSTPFAEATMKRKRPYALAAQSCITIISRTSVSPSHPGQYFLCSSMKYRAPSTASSFDFSSKSAYPPIISLASVNGPSVTLIRPPESRTLTPAAVGSSPPLPSSVPFLIASSDSLPMASINSLGGMPSASLCFTIIMYRIVTSPCVLRLVNHFLPGHPNQQPRLRFLLECFRPQHLPNFGLALPARPVLFMQLHKARGTLDRLFLRFQLKHRESAHHFLGLGVRPVNRGHLSSRKPHPRALRYRNQPPARDHRAGFGRVFAQLRHRFQEFRGRRSRVFTVFHQHQESHRCFSLIIWSSIPCQVPGRPRPSEPRLYLHVERRRMNSTVQNNFPAAVARQACSSFPQPCRESIPPSPRDLRVFVLILVLVLRVSEVRGLKQRPNFHLGLPVKRRALHPLHRLLHGPHLPNPVTSHQFLRLGERPINDRALLPRKPNPLALRARMQPVPRQHRARLNQFLAEFPHLASAFGVGHNARLGIPGRFHQHNNSHRILPFRLDWGRISVGVVSTHRSLALLTRRTNPG